MTRRAPHAHAGFTLLEVLVAMTVLVMLSSVAFAAVRMGQRTWQSGLEHASEIEALRVTATLLRRELAQVPPAEVTRDSTWLPLRGDSRALEFVAPAPRGSSTGGLMRYRVWLEPGEREDTGTLRLVGIPFDPGDPSDLSSRHAVATTLIAGLTDASFEYFGSPAAEQPAEWRATWGSTEERNPMLVRLRLERDSGASRWPDVLVAVGKAEVPP